MPQMSPMMWVSFPLIMVVVVLMGVAVLHGVSLVGSDVYTSVVEEKMKKW